MNDIFGQNFEKKKKFFSKKKKKKKKNFVNQNLLLEPIIKSISIELNYSDQKINEINQWFKSNDFYTLHDINQDESIWQHENFLSKRFKQKLKNFFLIMLFFLMRGIFFEKQIKRKKKKKKNKCYYLIRLVF